MCDIKPCRNIERALLYNRLIENREEIALDIAKKSGALGGKLLGAGKGGFLLFYAERKDHEKIIKSLKGLKNLKFKFESLGSKVIFKNKN